MSDQRGCGYGRSFLDCRCLRFLRASNRRMKYDTLMQMFTHSFLGLSPSYDDVEPVQPVLKFLVKNHMTQTLSLSLSLPPPLSLSSSLSLSLFLALSDLNLLQERGGWTDTLCLLSVLVAIQLECPPIQINLRNTKSFGDHMTVV